MSSLHETTSSNTPPRRYRVVVVGRPNVGKSTLFNRLLGRRRALVHNEPGVTRDRLEEHALWWVKGHEFPVSLVDTGGLGGERFSEEIKKQVLIALKDADVLLFVFDSQTGVTPLDEQLLRELQRSGMTKTAPLMAVVNKVDTEAHEERIADFFSLGIDSVLTISAEHGRGMDDLKAAIAETVHFSPAPKEASDELESDLDSEEEETENEELEESLDETSAEESEEDAEEENDEMNEDEEDEEKPKGSNRIPRIAIVGRPNVGKSTMMNAILGEERMITSPIAGTTVDSIDSLVSLQGKPFLFVDTAGMRRKSKTEQGIEVLSIVQTRKALENADIAVLVLDGEVGILDQDEKISGLIEEVGCSVVLIMNKWDTQSGNQKFTPELAAERIRDKMGHLKYAPILFVSALKNKGLNDLGSLLEEIMHQRQLKVPTHEFSEWIREQTDRNNPRNAKFYLSHQSGRNPPTFVCHVNDPDKIHFSLRRHLVNGIRERWGFMGSPVRLYFVEGKGKTGRVKPRPLSHKKKSPRKKNTPRHSNKKTG